MIETKCSEGQLINELSFLKITNINEACFEFYDYLTLFFLLSDDLTADDRILIKETFLNRVYKDNDKSIEDCNNFIVDTDVLDNTLTPEDLYMFLLKNEHAFRSIAVKPTIKKSKQRKHDSIMKKIYESTSSSNTVFKTNDLCIEYYLKQPKEKLHEYLNEFYPYKSNKYSSEFSYLISFFYKKKKKLKKIFDRLKNITFIYNDSSYASYNTINFSGDFLFFPYTFTKVLTSDDELEVLKKLQSGELKYFKFDLIKSYRTKEYSFSIMSLINGIESGRCNCIII